MSQAKHASTGLPSTIDARPYFEELLEDPECRAVHEQTKAEIEFVDHTVRAILERARELGISARDLAEKSFSPVRPVRRLLAGHPEKADFCTVVAVAAALRLKMSVSSLDDQPVGQVGAAAS